MQQTISPAGLRRAGSAAALSLAALLAGCAGLQQQSGQPVAAAAPAYRDSINVGGRISVQYEQNGNPQSLHGSFLWNQTPKQIDLEMFSPLGQTVATINVKPGIATLMQSGRAPQVAPDVDELAAQSLGWPLPVSGMRQWLQGTGTDAAGKRFTAKPGEDYAGFTTKDGWRVVYANWQVDPDSGETRPKRIDMTRDTEQAGKVAIRIAVDSWKQP
ncbi:outer membrane lipoprotein LolB [Herbaspirillum sp. LeCh32-8]|uniref:lipoprotein insertase outer membrane protein LolB n=1 Tax=Herbaspirillum sp. LeCh32-8 TaxID=2821356 RepID=UPI001AE2C95D|nr:lipoprotein insertase outer membrane protein LolB [Herbaspirillum sp. LeCh32-8]MBP0599973.1 outer membrane lipoprotein LolB [Herbaspirillum sp. LeCh32-8]